MKLYCVAVKLQSCGDALVTINHTTYCYIPENWNTQNFYASIINGIKQYKLYPELCSSRTIQQTSSMLPRTMFSHKQAYNSIADYLESRYLRRQYLKCNVTWNRVLSQANFWYWSIASRTFLWPPGTKQTAPKISRTATLVLIFSVLRLWAMVLMPVGCANTWALPFYRTVTVMSFYIYIWDGDSL